jgi:hypothetical protein
MTTSRVVLICVIFLVILTLLAGCVKPPENTGGSSGSSDGSSWFSPGTKGTPGTSKDNTGSTGGGGTTAGPTASPTETSSIIPATPFPVETPPPTTSSYTRLPDVTPEVPEYVAIFYNTLTFRQNKTAYSYKLERPPMVIEMCIRPNMTTRTIWYSYETKEGSAKGKTQTVTSISPAAWFEVTVRDQATGTIVAQEGFARSYSVETAKKITLRSAGTYLIEFGGNDLSAEVQIRVLKTETQTGPPVRTLSCGSLLL